jgi:hypothetical protein
LNFKIGAMTLSIMTFNIMTLSIRGLHVTHNISDSQQLIKTLVSSHTADSKPVKQEVNGTVILPPLVFPDWTIVSSLGIK